MSPEEKSFSSKASEETERLDAKSQNVGQRQNWILILKKLLRKSKFKKSASHPIRDQAWEPGVNPMNSLQACIYNTCKYYCF